MDTFFDKNIKKTPKDAEDTSLLIVILADDYQLKMDYR